jgi:hypothetical protein
MCVEVPDTVGKSENMPFFKVLPLMNELMEFPDRCLGAPCRVVLEIWNDLWRAWLEWGAYCHGLRYRSTLLGSRLLPTVKCPPKGITH